MIRLLAIFGLALSATTTVRANADERSRIDLFIRPRVADARFMGAVLVARGTSLLVNEGYGKASLEWQVPNSPDTRFRLGSLTKQFTAAAILLLEQRGKLHVHDPISQYLPDTPAAWHSITIFNLLTHTSGIPDLTTLPDFAATEAQPTTPQGLIGRFRDKPLDFRPGTDFKYSNSGYIVLGYIIETVTGQTYESFLRENIFIPLGMKSSGYDSSSAIVYRHARGYAPGKNGLTVAGYIDMTIPFAAGGLYSTTGDLLRWEQGLYGGKLLSVRSLAEMTTPFKKGYAFGVSVSLDSEGNRVFWHGGAIEGFNTFLAYVSGKKLAVIVLANVEGRAAREIGGHILAITGHDVSALD